MELKNLRVLWLADYTNIEVPAGGAEITDSHIIKAGKQLGYDITVVRPCNLRCDTVDKSDLVIFSNCYEFAKPSREYIMKSKPYVVYSHDSGRWLKVLKETPNMMKNALATIFLSPLHRDCFKKFLPADDKILLVPPHIPFTFYDTGCERVNKFMFVGNIHEGKGVDDVISFAKDNPTMIIDFYFNRYCASLKRTLNSLKNCNLIGYVPKEKIQENFNKYKYFIHIPRHYESFGRAVGEAYLCGCNLVLKFLSLFG